MMFVLVVCVVVWRVCCGIVMELYVLVEQQYDVFDVLFGIIVFVIEY